MARPTSNAIHLSIAVLVAACGGTPQLPAPQPKPSDAPSSKLEQAIAFARGTQGGRDYRKAAQIFERLCDDGNGDVRACRSLLHAIFEARGVRRDRLRVVPLADGMCQHDEMLGCTIVLLSASRPMSEAEKQRMLDRIDDSCKAGDPGACEGVHMMSGAVAVASDGTAAAQHREAVAYTACKTGVTAACIAVIDEVTKCGSQGGAPASCVKDAIAAWKTGGKSEKLDAFARLDRACTDGDATACEGIPGREIDAKLLCAAHDYGACATLGCLGDTRAEKLGRDHGAVPDCDKILGKRDAQNTPPPEPPAPFPPLRADPPVGPLELAPRKPFESVVFRQLATRNEEGWPHFEVHNTHSTKIRSIRVNAYGYDQSGNQVAHAEFGVLRHDIPSGGSVVLDNLGAGDPIPITATSFEPCYSWIEREGDSKGSVDQTRCPYQKPKRK